MMFRNRFFLFAMAPVCLLGPASLQSNQGMFEIAGRSSYEMSGFAMPSAGADLGVISHFEACRLATPGMAGAALCLAAELPAY